MLKKILWGIVGGGALMASHSVYAADVAPAPKQPTPMNTLSIEASPEFFGAASAKHAAGDLASIYYKAALSHSFENNFVIGGAFQLTQRAQEGGVGSSSSVDQIEASVAYKLKLDALTLTPSLLLGYGFGDQPKIDPNNNFNADAYYAATLAGDLKLNSHWTLNVFNVRYRNAFDYTWITPKISTGVTYKIDDTSAVYLNVGNAWKDKGDGKGLLEDKYNIAVGYKYSF